MNLLGLAFPTHCFQAPELGPSTADTPCAWMESHYTGTEYSAHPDHWGRDCILRRYLAEMLSPEGKLTSSHLGCRAGKYNIKSWKKRVEYDSFWAKKWLKKEIAWCAGMTQFIVSCCDQVCLPCSCLPLALEISQVNTPGTLQAASTTQWLREFSWLSFFLLTTPSLHTTALTETQGNDIDIELKQFWYKDRTC